MDSNQICLFNKLETHLLTQDLDGIFIRWRNKKCIVEDSCFKDFSMHEWEVIRNKILSFLKTKEQNRDNCCWIFVFNPQDELLFVGTNQINAARL